MVSLFNNVVEQCGVWVVNYLPTIFSALSALVISFFMGIYDKKNLSEIVAGPFVCAIFTLAISGSLEHLGFPDNAVNLVGGVIGFIGVDKLRYLVEGKLFSRFGVKENENQ
ncbi:phage holin, lambda family [Erwinia psidii]|uniref:Phage holin, lambda family n=1 Tax=Erwinia psidii TaxID=69224 RepID=A0A3N6S9B6_9GAMM|nr:phage holin, lambda family [Erwinia psidii]MCX8956368.1 phage holin, lambda family [Erwinia psidii]MCX8959874.1 phage holin, lambda family [Erwinia psidii]MCX8966506.1 phage holin, lambda family [Erwinia psidii]RQM36573.1 phage holin, lambda family [Erwinia psidii]